MFQLIRLCGDKVREMMNILFIFHLVLLLSQNTVVIRKVAGTKHVLWLVTIAWIGTEINSPMETSPGRFTTRHALCRCTHAQSVKFEQTSLVTGVLLSQTIFFFLPVLRIYNRWEQPRQKFFTRFIGYYCLQPKNVPTTIWKQIRKSKSNKAICSPYPLYR